MPDLFGDAIQSLELSMRFRVSRQGLLAANVANADTPGYRRVDISFDALLDREGTKLLRTHPRHLPLANPGPDDYRVERGPRGTRPDRNGVNLDSEVVELSRNAGAFTDQAGVLSRLLQLRRTAISGDG